MTIAAALRSIGGILVCADSLISGGDVNAARKKIYAFNVPIMNANVVIAYAGTVSHCEVVVSKLYHALNSLKSEDGPLTELVAAGVVEDVITQYHVRHLFTNPHFGYTGGPSVALLIAVQYRKDGTTIGTSLLTTEDDTVRAGGQYAFIGIGQSIAQYIIEPLAYLPLSAMPRKHTVLLADHVLHQVKRFVPGCGEASQYFWMGDDGSFYPPTTSMILPELYSSTFRRIMADMFYAAADLDKDDRLVSLGLELTDKRIKQIREEQRGEIERRAKLGPMTCDLPVIAIPWPLEDPVKGG